MHIRVKVRTRIIRIRLRLLLIWPYSFIYSPRWWTPLNAHLFVVPYSVWRHTIIYNFKITSAWVIFAKHSFPFI